MNAQFSQSMKFKNRCLASVMILTGFISGCSSSGSEESDKPVINDPASASVAESEQINLNLAFDPDGRIIQTEIVQVAGSVATPQGDTFIYMAPAVSEDEVLVFEVTATDNSGQTTSKRVDITVVANPELEDANFADPQLTACFNQRLAENASSETPWEDLYDVLSLDCIGYTVAELTGIDILANLEHFYVGDEENESTLSDIQLLSELKELKSLYLYNNQVTDISLLVHLENFNNLHLIDVPLDSYEPIANIDGLAFLHLVRMPVENLDFISGHTEMKSLFLDDNGLSDISVIANFPELEGLRLHNNPVTDLNALNGLTQLETLKITDVPLTDISAVASLTNLQLIKLLRTNVTDLEDLVGLERLRDVSLGRSPIQDLTPLVSISSLQNMAYIELDVTDFSILSSIDQLRFLSFAEEVVPDFSVFYDMDFLNRLELKLGPDFSCSDLAELESNLPSTQVIIASIEC